VMLSNLVKRLKRKGLSLSFINKGGLRNQRIEGLCLKKKLSKIRARQGGILQKINLSAR